MFKNISDSLLDDMLTYYKVQLIKEKERNQAIDPLNFYISQDYKINEISQRI